MKIITVSGSLTFQFDQLNEGVEPRVEAMAAIRAANEAISSHMGNPSIGFTSREGLVVECEPDEDELQERGLNEFPGPCPNCNSEIDNQGKCLGCGWIVP